MIAAASVSRAGAQISPGPLARPHAQLEGSLNCTKCHGTRKSEMNQACLSCHKEIAALREADRGYHARDAKGSCATCHPDHAGADFALIKWPDGSPERFDHRKAGWALEGKHAETACKDCHRARFRAGPIADASPRKTGAGWVGLEEKCTSCHEDPHKTALGANCVKCHDIKGWKPAPLFQHDSTSYPLTSKHADVACAKCHEAPRLAPARLANGDVNPVFKPVPHKDCVDCHADVHKGRLAGACLKCHVTKGWTSINKEGFDHDRTRYPLRGEHTQVACEACHVGFPSAGMRPAFASCTDCHKDPHAGKATLAGKIVGCDGCHTVEGFKPATYTVAQHATTKYPLLGKHAMVHCGACHAARTVTVTGAAGATKATMKYVEMRPGSTKCTDCHADDHGGQLASRPDKGACESCHKVDGWDKSTYAVAEHAKYKLPLEGRHAEIACGACHDAKPAGLPAFASTATLGKANVAFKITLVACKDCHLDPHKGRLTAPPVAVGASGCAACHDAKHFRPATYDVAAHARGAFALEGAHRAVPCEACHAEMKAPAPRSTLILANASFTPMPFTTKHDACTPCHQDPHGGQFATLKENGKCEACHGLDAFTPASQFDHLKVSKFALTGAHAKLGCADCHKRKLGADIKSVDYRGLSSACESCHSTPVRQ